MKSSVNFIYLKNYVFECFLPELFINLICKLVQISKTIKKIRNLSLLHEKFFWF